MAPGDAFLWLIDQEPRVAPFAHHGVFLIAMYEYVANVVEVDIVLVHAAEAEQERRVRGDNLKGYRAKRGANAHSAERHDVGVVTKADTMLTCRRGVQRDSGVLLL